MAAILNTTYKFPFLECKWRLFDSNLTKFCSKGSSSNNSSLVQGDGLAPTKQLAIYWTNVEPVQWIPSGFPFLVIHCGFEDKVKNYSTKNTWCFNEWWEFSKAIRYYETILSNEHT